MDRSDCGQTVKSATDAVPLGRPETESREASGDQPAPLSPVNMREDWRESCLSDFRSWLYALTDDELEAALQGGAVDGEARGSAFEAERLKAMEPDLETLFGELAALRQETRLVGRAGQQSERQLSALAETLRGELSEQGERLAQTAADLKAQLPAARREAQSAVLTELLSVRAALEDAVHAARARTLPNRPWLAAARGCLPRGRLACNWHWTRPTMPCGGCRLFRRPRRVPPSTPNGCGPWRRSSARTCRQEPS